MWLNIKEWIKTYDFKWKFKLIVCLPLFAALVAIDWITKGIVASKMTQGDSGVKSFINGFMEFKYIINPGSAYSANANNVSLAIALATVITLVVFVAFIFINNKKWIIAITFIFAGSFANLLARTWAPIVSDVNSEWYGTKNGVIDFMHFQFQLFGSSNYIFNMADVWVNVGVGLLIICAIIEFAIYIKSIIKSDKEESSK